MALPSRLKPAARAISKIAGTLSPTGIGVLLSVGAHAVLLASSPQTNFSFAALSQAAQEARAEETIVPVMQLSPAERNRLPSFAQPRSLSLPTTGLNSLPLPSGLPFIPRANTLPNNRQVPANGMPSAISKAPTTANLGILRNPPSTGSYRLNLPTTIPTPTPRSPSRPSGVQLIPGPPALPPTNTPNTPASPGSTDGEALPDLSTGSEAATPTPNSTTASVLEGLESAGNANNGQNAPTLPADPEKEPPKEEPPIDIAVGPSESEGAIAPNESPLIAIYDETNVSEDEAEQNLAQWLEGKENLLRGTAELTIDSGFKACREQPPVDGRLGVIVNPDGSREDVTILKSTGYDMLNRLAASKLDYQDFGVIEAPTHYEIEVKVNNESAGCVDNTAEAAPEEMPFIVPQQ